MLFFLILTNTVLFTDRPQKADVKEADGLQGVKKRLPVEVKHKLAKVARLAVYLYSVI